MDILSDDAAYRRRLTYILCFNVSHLPRSMAIRGCYGSSVVVVGSVGSKGKLTVERRSMRMCMGMVADLRIMATRLCGLFNGSAVLTFTF